MYLGNISIRTVFLSLVGLDLCSFLWKETLPVFHLACSNLRPHSSYTSVQVVVKCRSLAVMNNLGCQFDILERRNLN